MTHDEAQVHYPGAAEAVAFHEQQKGEGAWRVAREEELTPDSTITSMKMTMTAILAGYANYANDRALEGLYIVLSQMDHPDFHKYVRAKLGAV